MSLVSSPTTMIAVVVLACVVYFVYSAWNHNNKGITELKDKYDKLHKQLTHGVITDEQLNPLKIENASNMSEETMDYEYDKSGSSSGSESGSDTDTESDTSGSSSDREQIQRKRIHPRYQKQNRSLHSKLEGIVRDHHQHAPVPAIPVPSMHYPTPAVSEWKPNQGAVNPVPKSVQRVQEEGGLSVPSAAPIHNVSMHPATVSVPSPLHTVSIPGQEIIDDLKRLKSENIVLMDDSAQPSKNHTEEEIIEFHDIDDIDEHHEGPTIMAQVIDQKIRGDLERMDQENALLEQHITEQQKKEVKVPNTSTIVRKKEPKSASEPKPKLKVLTKPKTPKPDPSSAAKAAGDAALSRTKTVSVTVKPNITTSPVIKVTPKIKKMVKI